MAPIIAGSLCMTGMLHIAAGETHLQCRDTELLASHRFFEKLSS